MRNYHKYLENTAVTPENWFWDEFAALLRVGQRLGLEMNSRLLGLFHVCSWWFGGSVKVNNRDGLLGGLRLLIQRPRITENPNPIPCQSIRMILIVHSRQCMIQLDSLSVSLVFGWTMEQLAVTMLVSVEFLGERIMEHKNPTSQCTSLEE
jgi:hypothetical protein